MTRAVWQVPSPSVRTFLLFGEHRSPMRIKWSPTLENRLRSPPHRSSCSTLAMAYCDTCNRFFTSEHSFQQHRETSSKHNWCDDCERDFRTYSSLQQHWTNSSMHHYCEPCEEHFDDEYDLEAHDEAEHNLCTLCTRVCDST